VRGHKLQDLINRHGFEAGNRHRAYDDAHVLWQFYQLVLSEFDLDTVDTAIAAQFKQPGRLSDLV
jgi:DNA polymerase III epsilon subunit-like protein